MNDLDTADQPSESEIEGTSNLASLLGIEAKTEGEPKEAPKADLQTAEHVEEDEAPKVEAAPEEEEIDLGEVKLKLPKDQAEAVKRAALRQQDYTQKTMALAEQRKAVEAEAQRFQAQQQQLAQNFAQIRAQVEQAVQTGQLAPPDQSLLDSDPVTYLKQRDQWERAQQAYNAARWEQEQIQRQQEQTQQQQLASRLQAEQEQLLAKFPEWQDAGKAQAERSAIREYLQKAGFSDQEIAQVQDHRAVVMAREAMLYRKMVAEQKSIAEKKVAAAPPRAIKPNAAQDGPTTTINKSAAQRLKASGGRDMQSAGQAIASLLYGA